jgi:glycerol-3-phosphate responsive antiterminator
MRVLSEVQRKKKKKSMNAVIWLEWVQMVTAVRNGGKYSVVHGDVLTGVKGKYEVNR